eukprot:22546_1
MTIESSRGVHVLWARESPTDPFIPALWIRPGMEGAFMREVEFSTRILGSPDNGANMNALEPTIAHAPPCTQSLCSACSLFVGLAPYFYCPQHKRHLCARCFELLCGAPYASKVHVKQIRVIRPSSAPTSGVYGAYVRSIVFPKPEETAVPQQSPGLNDKELNSAKSTNAALVCDSESIISPTESSKDNNTHQTDSQIISVLWLDSSGRVSRLRRDHTREFLPHLARFSDPMLCSELNERQLSVSEFLQLRRAVRAGLILVGRLGVCCEVLLENDRTPHTSDTSDDQCAYCREGGELLCCDTCARVYHVKCTRLEDIPDGDWFCAFCCEPSAFLGVSGFKRIESTRENKRKRKREVLSVSVEPTEDQSGELAEDNSEPESDSPKRKKRSTDDHNSESSARTPVTSAHEKEREKARHILKIPTRDRSFQPVTGVEAVRFAVLDQFASGLCHKKSALNFLADFSFGVESVEIIRIPRDYRYPPLEPDGTGGYSESFHALKMVRPQAFLAIQRFSTWTVNQVDIASIQSFLRKHRKSSRKLRHFNKRSIAEARRSLSMSSNQKTMQDGGIRNVLNSSTSPQRLNFSVHREPNEKRITKKPKRLDLISILRREISELEAEFGECGAVLDELAKEARVIRRKAQVLRERESDASQRFKARRSRRGICLARNAALERQIDDCRAKARALEGGSWGKNALLDPEEVTSLLARFDDECRYNNNSSSDLKDDPNDSDFSVDSLSEPEDESAVKSTKLCEKHFEEHPEYSIAEKNFYTPEKIMGEMFLHERLHYCVKWEPFVDAKVLTSWEPADTLCRFEDKIQAYMCDIQKIYECTGSQMFEDVKSSSDFDRN